MEINRIKDIEIKDIEILDFEKELSLELVINERNGANTQYTGKKYYCSFEDIEVKDGIMLVSAFGNGNTIDESIKAYCKRIGNKFLVQGSHTKNRIEIASPKLVHTRLLNK